MSQFSPPNVSHEPGADPVPEGRHARGGATEVDVDALKRDLEAEVDGEVRFTNGDRALYATDASNYRQVPIGVVVPRTVDAIATAVTVCARHGAPIVHRGGGTALAGQTCNTAVVIDASKYCNRIVDIDWDAETAIVEPGIVLDELQQVVNPKNLRFGPDPSTHSRCTLGGMIGNNSCGVHSLAYGRTVDNVKALEIMTYDGLRMTVGETSAEEFDRIQAEGGRKADIYRQLKDIADANAERIRHVYPGIPRRVSGFNLNELLPENSFNVARALVGTESTCVTVLRAHLNLRFEPPHRVVLAAGFKDIFQAADLVPGITRFEPLGCEGIDQRLTEFMRLKCLHVEDLELLPDGCAWLLIPCGAADKDEAREKADAIHDWLKGQDAFTDGKVIEDRGEQGRLWKVREAGLGATAFVPGAARDTWPGWEDSAVPPEDLGNYLRDLFKLFDKYGYYASVYGHFGEGLIHTRIDFGLHDAEDAATFRRFMEDAAHMVVRHNGSLSGEHGDGQARGELLPIMYGQDLVDAFRAFKHAWDPRGKMNPGKVIDARPLDMDLRLGPRFHPPPEEKIDAQFTYPHSDHSFLRETMRCVGVGKCRNLHDGTMCPSYRATREEKHSTRGRAHMLQEMLQGDPLTHGWQEDAVWESLDLCLACKACKSECPVDVDMATYKAEFAYHYFKKNRRPRAAWSMGRIQDWAKLAAPAPWLANALSQTPGLNAAAKWIAGVHQARALPRFQKTFRARFNGNGSRPSDTKRQRVVLFADTFNDHFTPEALVAAAEVLEDAGFAVELPKRKVCCGRPLYDFGFLDQARKTLNDVMDSVDEAVRDGAYVVGLEPACMATFKDELGNLFEGDPRAERLAKATWLLPDFLARVADADGWNPPRLSGKALVHPHCNHRAIFGTGGEKQALSATGLEVEVLDSGCCGMAGSFGFEHDKYDVSQAILNDKLMPMIRGAGADRDGDGAPRLVVDGYSCREQLRQATGRLYPTVAEVLRDGLHQGRSNGNPPS
ncbi:lactate dehydrogenase like protein [Caenispirillum salinarum AK4]|uniref:Lactate dehydrogenase like protein n=1 Tax=Caenispirillum salinarum AK4 TaxID=1238182 RepID=K9H2H5_9PROT|nr:FAD-binding and (Fe-S)-binding domain-containing protein [Caenispirillum salinarum]EKV31777.1 lactate dehydrogenase like protein [Caenispirillum salinarum AK4]